jgi:hypothetical protein
MDALNFSIEYCCQVLLRGASQYDLHRHLRPSYAYKKLTSFYRCPLGEQQLQKNCSQQAQWLSQEVGYGWYRQHEHQQG